jgi:predicted TIM-barrel fold metal-dependent hydrolase
MSIDPGAVDAIDVHTHVNRSHLTGETHPPDSPEGAVAVYFGNESIKTLPEMVEMYRERRIAFVTFMVDNVEQPQPVGNEEILELAEEYSDVVVPFASVDPRRGSDAVAMARELIAAGARGFKFHPSLQGFEPNDLAHYPLYEAIATAGVPALFHTGQTGVGAGLPGGGGIKLRHSNPMLLDDVAADLPELTLILAHPAVPWTDEAMAVATHKPNVYIDLSGWAPKYLPPQLVRQANNILKHKLLFGTDYPALTPDRWLAEFAELPIKDEVRPLILKENACRVLGLA